jgi:hypothetical protein
MPLPNLSLSGRTLGIRSLIDWSVAQRWFPQHGTKTSYLEAVIYL